MRAGAVVLSFCIGLVMGGYGQVVASGLHVSPCGNMDWFDTREWVEGLEGGWRMASVEEIRELADEGSLPDSVYGSESIVWSRDARGYSSVWAYDAAEDRVTWVDPDMEMPGCQIAIPEAGEAPSVDAPVERPESFDGYPDAVEAMLEAGLEAEYLKRVLMQWDALPLPLRGQVVSADLTGDGAEEVALAIKDPEDWHLFGSGCLLVYDIQGPEPGLLLQRDVNCGGVGIDTVVNANEAGPLDLCYVVVRGGANIVSESLEVVEWDGESFRSLMGDAVRMPWGSFSVTPGRIEAEFGMYASAGAQPQQGYTDFFAIEDGVFGFSHREYEAPFYRYHALLDGDRAMRDGDLEEAAECYRSVLDDESLEGWCEDEEMLGAMARWRLICIAAVEGDREAAEQQLSHLRDAVAAEDRAYPVRRLAESYMDACTVGGDSVEVESIFVRKLYDGAFDEVVEFFNGNYGYANPHWDREDLVLAPPERSLT